MGQLQVNQRIILLTFSLVAAASIGLPGYAGDVKVAAKFDANRLRTGTFVYQNLMGEKDIGKSEISIRKTPGASTFEFSNVVTGEFSQRWTAITKENLQPTSAKLSSGQGRGNPVFDLKYTSDRVTGFSMRKGSRRLVDDKIPLEVVDQRVDWAAVTASDLKPGQNFEFEVYDPNIGVSHVIVRVATAASVKVPAGQFEVYPATYQIGKRTGVEQYRVLVTIRKPRMLVREEFPDGTTTDLVSGPINSVAFVGIKMGRRSGSCRTRGGCISEWIRNRSRGRGTAAGPFSSQPSGPWQVGCFSALLTPQVSIQICSSLVPVRLAPP